MLARWLKIEYCVWAACAKRRVNNLGCGLLNSRKASRGIDYHPEELRMFWEGMAPENLSTHDNYDKRYTVNTIGYRIGQIKHSYSRKTVEFRFPESLLNADHIGNWVRFLLCFVDDCCNATIPPKDVSAVSTILEALQLVGLQSSEDFYLLDQKLYDAKMWFLQRIDGRKDGSIYGKEPSELLAFMQQI